MLSRWHVHANDYCNQISKHPEAEVSAVWDEDPERGSSWAEEMGVPFVRELQSVLQDPNIDGVCVVTPTNMHRDVMIAAAEAGKHIFTEKVLTPTVAEAREVADAIRANQIKFCISFPRRGLPALQYAKHAIDQGLIGKVTLIRIRIAHAGASRDWLPPHFYDAVACGGGAMMDLGAHGMYLSCWLAGNPKRVTSVFTSLTGKEVEDNAVSVIEFESGAIAVNETSFVGFPDSYSLEVDGTEGGIRMLSPRSGVELRSDHVEEKGWHEVESVPVASKGPIAQWIDACLRNEPIDYGIDDAVQLTEVMAAAYAAHQDHSNVAIERA